MESEKLSLKQILACVDLGYTNAWDEFTDEEKKSVSFWLLNRYASSVSGSRAKQENAIIKTNEFYNKNFYNINLSKEKGHHELMWHLLCMCGSTGKQEFHKWISYKMKSEDKEKIKLIEQLYPELKSDEVQTLAGISTDEEIRELVKKYNE